MREYLFYPGCALDASSAHYYKSAVGACKQLGIVLKELPDWSCCGATAYVGSDEDKAVAYSARNLAIAQSLGADELVTACNACYVTLRKAEKLFVNGPDIRDNVSRALRAAGLSYNGGVNVRHIAEVLLTDVGPAEIAAKVTRRLDGLRVATYHGCLLTRPFSDIGDPERPTLLNRVLVPTGATMVPFPLTARCCGGMMMSTRRDEVGIPLVYDILSCAKAMGAQCIAVACPLCSVNLEGYQDQVARRYNWPERMPIVLFTQLLGIALGASAEAVGLEQCIVDPEPLLAAYA